MVIFNPWKYFRSSSSIPYEYSHMLNEHIGVKMSILEWRSSQEMAFIIPIKLFQQLRWLPKMLINPWRDSQNLYLTPFRCLQMWFCLAKNQNISIMWQLYLSGTISKASKNYLQLLILMNMSFKSSQWLKKGLKVSWRSHIGGIYYLY